MCSFEKKTRSKKTLPDPRQLVSLWSWQKWSWKYPPEASFFPFASQGSRRLPFFLVDKRCVFYGGSKREEFCKKNFMFQHLHSRFCSHFFWKGFLKTNLVVISMVCNPRNSNLSFRTQNQPQPNPNHRHLSFRNQDTINGVDHRTKAISRSVASIPSVNWTSRAEGSPVEVRRALKNCVTVESFAENLRG